MKTFKIHFSTGAFRCLEADRYERTDGHFEFYRLEKIIASYPSTLRIEEVAYVPSKLDGP